jgi:hypothetical protein
MAFRAELRRALAAPLGGPLGRTVHLPALTAVIADGRDGEREEVALAEMLDALVRVGVPRGRQLVLLAHAAREHASRLRTILGVPVIAHDPLRASGWVAGKLANGVTVELDDELREAEELVLLGACGAAPESGPRGGAAALWPGLASGAAVAAHAGTLPQAPEARCVAGLAAAREVLALVPAAFALLWNDADPPRVRAGVTAAVLDACEADGWFTPRPRRSPADRAGGSASA